MTSVNQRLCSLSARGHTTLSTLQFFSFVLFLGEWSNIPPGFFFSLSPSDVPMQRSFRGLKVGHDCGLCLQTPNGNILTPKPPLSFHFVSRGFKSRQVYLWCWRQIRRSAPQCRFQFQGVDRKQNMYHEVGGLSPVNYKLSTVEGGVKKKERKKECGWLRSGPRPRFALLSSIEGLAGRSWGRYLKSYFPQSPSLTRMHDKAFCQQGQEEGSQL